MAKYKNPVFNFADRHPFVAFILVPIGMNLVGRATAMAIRSAKYGSPLSAIMPNANDEQPNFGSIIRKQGGDELDLMFRATARSGPNEMDSSEREFIQPQPESRPVRYDLPWHDEIFLPDPNYKSRETPVTQVSVFAGLNGLSKINR